MQYLFPQVIRSNYEGYIVLADLANRSKGLAFDELVLDFRAVQWLEANLFAVLGAIASSAEKELNEIRFENVPDNLLTVMRRNEFINYFGRTYARDFYDTTISYKPFQPHEKRIFKDYIDKELLGKSNLPSMSDPLKKKINESIFEAFDNAIIHGKSQKIYGCGQYYPKLGRLDFTLVNLGYSIRYKVNDHLQAEFSGSEAIEWAAQEGNTTKRGNIPGGLGISLIRDFLKHNGGKIQLISDTGFWQEDGEFITRKELAQPFPGTIVNIEFNVNDSTHYDLEFDEDEEDIF